MPVHHDIDGVAEQARQAAQRHDWDEAFRCWERLRTIAPGHAQAYLGLSHALRAAGRLDEADAVLTAGVRQLPDNEPLAIAHASFASMRRDWPTALARWEAARVRFPGNPHCLLGTINALRGTGNSDRIEPLAKQASAVLAAARLSGFDETAALRVEFEIARIRLDWQGVRRAAEQIAAREAPSADILLALAQACLRLEDATTADHAAQQAIAANPNLTEAWMVRLQIATASGDGEVAAACYGALIELNPKLVRWKLKRTQLLNWLGRVDEAQSELEQVSRESADDPLVRAFVQSYGAEEESGREAVISASDRTQDDPDFAKENEIALIAKQAPPEGERVRPLVVVDAQRDVLIAEMAGAKAAVLVFTGTNDEVAMPLALFDQYLATVPVTAVYLKDFQRLRYLRGIRSMGHDFESTLPALRKLLDSLSVQRFYTLGNCVGGFGAIRYGVALEAARVLAFSPPTYSPLETPAKLEEGRRFMKRRLEENVSRDLMDLQPFLESAAYRGEIELFYEERDPRDKLNALRLSGLPGVRLRARQELSFRLLRRMVSSSDGFCEMLRELLPGGPTRG